MANKATFKRRDIFSSFTLRGKTTKLIPAIGGDPRQKKRRLRFFESQKLFCVLGQGKISKFDKAARELGNIDVEQLFPREQKQFVELRYGLGEDESVVTLVAWPIDAAVLTCVGTQTLRDSVKNEPTPSTHHEGTKSSVEISRLLCAAAQTQSSVLELSVDSCSLFSDKEYDVNWLTVKTEHLKAIRFTENKLKRRFYSL